MKLILVLSFIFGMFLVGSVNAGSCADDDRIMKLYSESNSHGALWNDITYAYDICCEDIFGVGDSSCNTGIHTCSGNKVLGLYDTYNAHAQKPELDSYNVDVCYGDLSCTYVSGACPTDYFCVVTLYSEDNSHLADCNSAQAYSNKICCSKTPDITRAYWADMREQPITQTNLSDRVQLRVGGVDMENKQINYTIYKDVWYWFDSKQAETSTTGFTTWRPDELGNYYFEAVVENDEAIQSGNLEVLPEQNSPPYVEILNPKDGEIYYKNEMMNFNQVSWDDDDQLTTTWYFSDGSTSTDINTTYSYSTTGQKIINLVGIDERGLIASDAVSILVIDPLTDGEYVYAKIDEPEWGESFFADTIDFNASSTYAINATGCGGSSCTTITCTAGECPLLTHEGGQSIDAGSRGDYTPLNFYWEFDEGTWYNASGIDGVFFNWTFQKAGEHKAVLTAKKNPESTTTVIFSNFFDKPYCYRDSESDDTFWYEPSGNVIPSIGDCYRVDGLPTTDCCPPGYLCNNGACELLEGIPGCGQYTEFGQEVCENYFLPAEDELNPVLAEQGLECGQAEQYGTNCWEIVDCYCAFDNGACSAVSGHKICDANSCYDFVSLPGDIQTTCNAAEAPVSGQCSMGFESVDECETSGFITRIWTALWVGTAARPDYCIDGEDQIPCKSAKLIFWGVLGIIGAIIGIIIIYLILAKKKTRKKRK